MSTLPIIFCEGLQEKRQILAIRGSDDDSIVFPVCAPPLIVQVFLRSKRSRMRWSVKSEELLDVLDSVE
jgi:hypothetical protein